MAKEQSLKSLDEDGNPYDFIIVIDAGSRGTRAYLYRTKEMNYSRVVSGDNGIGVSVGGGESDDEDLEGDPDLEPIKEHLDVEDDTDDDESDDEDHGKIQRDWKEGSVEANSKSSFPDIQLIKHKKVKPGIATMGHKIGKKNIGKILNSVIKHVPKDQVKRTPVFLHATGGMRILKHEEQSRILGDVCAYIKDNYDLFLPDCDSHINTISGEVEGLYAWIGVNYKYGVLDIEKDGRKGVSSLGMLDMGGVSSQIAFEPFEPEMKEVLFDLELNYLNQEAGDGDVLKFGVFSRSLMSGMHQAHLKYDESLVAKDDRVDPCLPEGYSKKIKNAEGENVMIEGGGSFENCLNSLYDVLLEVSKDKYCNQTDTHSTSSCLLSDELPKMDFKVNKFIGVNKFYSSLENFVNYKEFYESTRKNCEASYAELLKDEEFKDEKDKITEVCFRSSWIIDVLHQGVNFPRYGIDEVGDDSQMIPNEDRFGILDHYSWTLGRAVLYSYYEAAERLMDDKSKKPLVGYYEPSSKRFVYGAEQPGVLSRPAYGLRDGGSLKHDNGKSFGDDDDNDDDDNDWDDVFEEHRLWGSLLMLFMLLVVGWLLLGKIRRRAFLETVKRMWNERRSGNYGQISVNHDVELGDFELNDEELALEDREVNLSENQQSKKIRDSFELSE